MDNLFLSLGSNLGNRLENLQMAVKAIERSIGAIIQSSSIFETSPWGYSDPNMYLNQVVQVNTIYKPAEILLKINEIEQSMGRIRGNERYTARTIDMDILFYGNIIYNSTDLTIPHPKIQNRKFILIPFSEIAGYFIHPVLKKTVKGLLEECADSGIVRVYEI